MNFLKRQKLKIKLIKSGRRNQILRQLFCRGPFSNVLNTSAKNCSNTQKFKHKLNNFELRRD